MGAETRVATPITTKPIERDEGPLAPRGDMRSIVREHGWEPLAIEGTIPEALRGTLHRVGPGLYESFGRGVAHSFEADGAVCSVRLEAEGRASFAVRLIESAGLRAERRAGKPLYGSRATPLRRLANGLLRRRKNTGNTAMMQWQSRLFALVESSRPTELDPRDLRTLGETSLGGAIGSAFTAHPHRVNAREALYGFGMRWGPKNAIELHVLPDRGAARRLGEIALEHGVLLHDFAATPRHLVFLVPPMRFMLVNALLGRGGASDIFKWTPEDGVEVIVVSIDDPSNVVRFRVETFFQWHFAGAYQDGDELVLHIARWPDFDSYEGLRSTGVTQGGSGKPQGAQLHEVRIDPARRRFQSAPVWGPLCEFPEIDPRHEGERYGVVFVTTVQGARRGVARIDLARREDATFLFEPGVCPSEMIFVPRDASAPEGDGYGLTMVYDPKREASGLAIFDTARIADGPIARCWAQSHVPMTFHGVWSPSERG